MRTMAVVKQAGTCARCGESTDGRLTYRTTISGGSRVVRMTGSNDEPGAMHKPCALARKEELDAKDRAIRDSKREASVGDHSHVAIYDDGMGTYQAQCLGCEWKGPWRRKVEKTHEDAGEHSTVSKTGAADYTIFGVNGGYETRCTHPGCRHHYKSTDEAEAIERIENHARTHKMASANPTIEQASRALMSTEYNKLLSEWTGGYGNTAVFGGCRVAAEALQKLFGGEIYALIADRDIDDPTYVPMVQHYVVKTGGGFIDARGRVSEHQLTNDDDFYFADKLVPATPKIIEYNRNIWSSPEAVRKTVDFIKEHS